MEKHKIIIDCDPGQDDALMLFMALSRPDMLDVLGITAVAGNVPLPKTQRNARILTEISGRTDIPIFAGYDAPLEVPLATAEEVHGREGIDGIEIYEPSIPLQQKGAVDFIVETLMAAQDASITLVPTGPLTNIAVALQQQPAIAPKIKEIVLMGGAMREGGNITPSAEFNIYVDPHAAKIVFDTTIPIVAFGLDLTHQVYVSPDIPERLKALGNAPAIASHAILSLYDQNDPAKHEAQGAPLHDPCTIAYLLQPSLFELKHCNVAIETASDLTRGHTAVDFWNVTDRPRNTKWAYTANRDGFFDLLTDCLSRYER